MRLYFSSHQHEQEGNDPELVLKPADVMVSFWQNRKTLHPRTELLIKHRKQKRKDRKHESK